MFRKVYSLHNMSKSTYFKVFNWLHDSIVTVNTSGHDRSEKQMLWQLAWTFFDAWLLLFDCILPNISSYTVSCYLILLEVFPIKIGPVMVRSQHRKHRKNGAKAAPTFFLVQTKEALNVRG